MTGTYQTDDNCVYEVYYHKTGKPVKIELMAKCIKSTVRQGDQEPFIIKEENILRNVRHNLWTRLEP